MARYQRQKVVIRELRTGIRIILFDKGTIYVQSNGLTCAFHRWDVRKKNYYTNNWRPFRDRMRKYKTLSLYDCYRLASQFEISTMVLGRPLELDKDEIIVEYEYD